jgi:hypothetical protein
MKRTPRVHPREMKLVHCSAQVNFLQPRDGLRDAWLGFDFRQGHEILLFPTAFRPALEPIQPPGRLSPVGKMAGSVDQYSPPANAAVKDDGNMSLLPHVFLTWCFIN